LASVVVHLALFVGLWHVVQFPRAIGLLLDERPPSSDPAPERVRYFVVGPETPAVARPLAVPQNVAGRIRESARPVELAPVAPPLVAPTEVPTTLPPVPRAAEGPERGPLASGRGAVRGVQPGYTEPRIWVEGEAVVAPALTGDAKLDSAISARVMAYRDSVSTYAIQPNKFERGDWTVEKDGKKYGIDRQFIRLGKFSIPTALLGLLPMNQQGNPIAYEREKRLAMMRSEILEQAQQAMNEEEFRRAVKAIRDRKEKERKAAEEKKKKDAATRIISDY
jgi:hypothetical protein